MNDYKLDTEEIKIIEGFQKKIQESEIGNENKIYLSYFIKGLLAENFLASANLGFTFLEKYLRTKLVFLEHQKKGLPKNTFLKSLDEIEKILEDGEGDNQVSHSFNSLKKNIQQYGFNPEIKEEDLLEELRNYIKKVNMDCPYPKNGYSFNDICKKLYEYGKIDNILKKNLISIYAQYRNPSHHGLFKRLIDSFNGEEKTMPIYCGGIKNPGIQDVLISNPIIRETQDFLTPISRIITIKILSLINQVIEIFGDFKN